MTKLEAHFENRIYFFIVKNKSSDEVSIDMYGTPYTFIKKAGKWENRTGNKMNMVSGLIDAVIATTQP
ncbi:hypothetical protein [Filimonas effusa]|uniref:Uncharacterized protein n=1 Tax=Filimonas effusa TaxID=2508721 RepID=A0A4Q1D2K9_9BACT|nr:hypothetical protein [Filimonas effusa]RXK81321.1 hypothetical protein ESB13_20510 [Filimonas effusa]